MDDTTTDSDQQVWKSLDACWAIRDSDLGPADFKVWLAVVLSCNEDGTCYPSVSELARRSRTSRATVQRWVARAPAFVVGEGTRVVDGVREKVRRTVHVNIDTRRWTGSGDKDTHEYRLRLVVESLGVASGRTDPASPRTDGGLTQNRRVASPRTDGGLREVHKEDHGRGSLKRITEERDDPEGDPWGLTPVPDEPEPTPTVPAGVSIADTVADSGLSGTPSTIESAIVRVFEAWREDTGHPRAKLDPKRRRRIAARLREGFTVDELITAIRHRKNDPWLMGEHPKNPTVYDQIDTLLRDAAQVERLRDLAAPLARTDGSPRNPAPQPPAAKSEDRIRVPVGLPPEPEPAGEPAKAVNQ